MGKKEKDRVQRIDKKKKEGKQIKCFLKSYLLYILNPLIFIS